MNSQEEIYERLELSVARLGDIRDEMWGLNHPYGDSRIIDTTNVLYLLHQRHTALLL